MFDDLLDIRQPPPNRIGTCTEGREQHLTEGAVMVAYAMHLLRTTDAPLVLIHPDGEHGKRFAFRGWLERQGYMHQAAIGTTDYGGLYEDSRGRQVRVVPKPGLGDIRATTTTGVIVAEAKGGVINSRHPGQLSRLKKGLCEAVGLLLFEPQTDGVRQVAVVPHTDHTRRWAERMATRVRAAGISIALVNGIGAVTDIC